MFYGPKIPKRSCYIIVVCLFILISINLVWHSFNSAEQLDLKVHLPRLGKKFNLYV